MDTPSAIMIKLPEVFGGKEARKLGRELRKKITTKEPCVVVDFSRVKHIDLEGVEGLLHCMEQIAKQDGALQVGGISPEAATFLELTRMDQLFRKFPTFPLDAQNFVLSQEAAAEEVQPQEQGQGTAQPQTVAA